MSTMSPELLQSLVEGKRAKIEPFNDAFAKLSMRRPKPNLERFGDRMNRFFAEGGPEYNPGTLVRMDIVREAFSGSHMPSFGTLMRYAAAAGKARKSGDPMEIERAEQEHEEYRLLCLVADGMQTNYCQAELDSPALTLSM